MNFIARWKAKRELKKSIKLLERMCSEMQLSFFSNLIQNSDGTFASPIEAVNWISANLGRIKREL